MATLDLAAIGNCAIASLIDRNARHVWFCFPRLDGDPVFSALINGEDPQQGFMDVVVCDAVETTQRYIRNTAVLATIITDKNGGQVRIVDFAPRTPRFGRSFRPPMLIRRIEPLTKRVRLKVRIRPHFNYGATKPTISFGSNHVRYSGGQMTLRVTTDMAIAYLWKKPNSRSTSRSIFSSALTNPCRKHLTHWRKVFSPRRLRIGRPGSAVSLFRSNGRTRSSARRSR